MAPNCKVNQTPNTVADQTIYPTVPATQIDPPDLNYLDLTPTDFTIYFQHNFPSGPQIHTLRISVFLFSPFRKVLLLQDPSVESFWRLPSRQYIFPQSESEHPGLVDPRDASIEKIAKDDLLGSMKSPLEQKSGALTCLGKEEEEIIYSVHGAWLQQQKSCPGKKAVRFEVKQVPVLALEVAIPLAASTNLVFKKWGNSQGRGFSLDGKEFWKEYRWCDEEEAVEMLYGKEEMARKVFERMKGYVEVPKGG